MAPFEIHSHAALRLNGGVFNNSGTKQAEPGTAFNPHLEVFISVRAQAFIHTDRLAKEDEN